MMISQKANPTKQRLTSCSLIVLAFALFTQSGFAWDGVGHRISAAVASQFISIETREKLLDILEHHPRYQEDFLDQMPEFIASGDGDSRAQWLLGQAAYWPDIARGLPERERNRFNRPPWHYSDGAWVRDSALLAGNIYVDLAAFPLRQGEPGASIRSEADVHNVVTALDYNTQLLSHSDRPAEQRAVALCWVLHLIGDIHQPMHTGSLFSAHTFADGDLGGNRIPVEIPGGTSNSDLNLHGLWDRALRDFGVADSLSPILQQVSGFSTPRIQGVASDWTAWLGESRQLLQAQVYTDTIKTAAQHAEDQRLDEIEQPVALDANYISRMQQLARLRLGLAGLRLAIWFENNLP